MKKVLVIGIAGGSGSGKTAITELLRTSFQSHVAVLHHDDYYREQHLVPIVKREEENYDCPEAFDNELFIEQIRALCRREAVQCPVYDYAIHDRTGQTRMIFPTDVLIVDGILVLAEPKIRELFDIKIFVDTDADIRILRRVRRDVNRRHRTLESVVHQYLTTVKPMHEAYVEPSKKFADIIIPEGAHNLVAMKMLEDSVKKHIDSVK